MSTEANECGESRDRSPESPNLCFAVLQENLQAEDEESTLLLHFLFEHIQGCAGVQFDGFKSCDAQLEEALRAKRKDANHNAIADYLQRLGWSVLDTSALGRGFPDCAVGCPGWAALVEIKRDTKAKLTPDEARVRILWRGPYVLAVSPEDAAEQLLALKRKWIGA